MLSLSPLSCCSPQAGFHTGTGWDGTGEAHSPAGSQLTACLTLLHSFENLALNTTWTGHKTPAPRHSTQSNKPERWPGWQRWAWLLVFNRVKLPCDLFTCLAWGAYRFCLVVCPVCIGQHFSARTCLPGTFHSHGQHAQLPATALN